MTRQSFQKGCVYLKKGKWYGRYRTSEYLPDGSLVRRQRHLLLGTGGELPRKLDAERELAGRLAEINEGTYRPESTLTLANFVEKEYRPKTWLGFDHPPKALTRQRSIVTFCLCWVGGA